MGLGVRAAVVAAVASMLLATSCGKRAPTSPGGEKASPGSASAGEVTEDEVTAERPATRGRGPRRSRRQSTGRFAASSGCCVSAIEPAGIDRKGRSLVVATIDAGDPAASRAAWSRLRLEPDAFGSGVLDKEPSPSRREGRRAGRRRGGRERRRRRGRRDEDQAERRGRERRRRPRRLSPVRVPPGRPHEGQDPRAPAADRGVQQRVRRRRRRRGRRSRWTRKRRRSPPAVGRLRTGAGTRRPRWDSIRCASSATASRRSGCSTRTRLRESWDLELRHLPGQRRLGRSPTARDGGSKRRPPRSATAARSDEHRCVEDYKALIVIPRVELPARVRTQDGLAIDRARATAARWSTATSTASPSTAARDAPRTRRCACWSRRTACCSSRSTDDRWTRERKELGQGRSHRAVAGAARACVRPGYLRRSAGAGPDPSRQWGIRISDGQVVPGLRIARTAGRRRGGPRRRHGARPDPVGDWLKWQGEDDDADGRLQRQRRRPSTEAVDRDQHDRARAGN